MFVIHLKLFIAMLIVSFFGLSQSYAACGKFVVVKGDVQIDVAKTSKTEKAKMNSEICSGDTVSALKDSRAKIVMVDGNELNISPDTKMIIEGYEFQPDKEKKKVLLNVLFGKVRANVKQKYDDQSSDGPKDGASNTFQIKTKSAVAGVRGTDFLTSYTPATGRSEVVTFSGKVDVGQAGPNGQIINPIGVGPGQKTFVNPNQRAAPAITVPAAELKQMNSTSKADSAANIPAKGQPPAASQANNSDKKERAPASVPPMSIGAAMMDPNDLGGAAGSAVPDFSKSPVGSAPALPIQTPVTFQPPVCPICNAAIQSGPSVVNIAITTRK
jgi:hypothetical protein